MDFLQKLDFMMERYSLNKRKLSQNSGIPYTTIDGWYKKGYEGMKISTLRMLSSYFNTVLEFWIQDDITDPNYGKTLPREKEKPSAQGGEQKGLPEKYYKLSEEGRRIIDQMIDFYIDKQEKE